MNENYVQLTVGDLRVRLAEYPDDTLVFVEGCDCDGPAGEPYPGREGGVYISRADLDY